MKVRLFYHRGTIVIKGNVHVPFAKWDERSKSYRALAYKYRDIVEFLEQEEIEFEDHVFDNAIPSPIYDVEFDFELRDYQKEAVERFLRFKRGVVVLPTGAGKTIIALEIIRRLSVSTLVVVPTLALLEQWKDRLSIFGDVGEFSGKKKELKPITVTTYDSAYINAELLGDKFFFLIFDECHHLPSEAYRNIAQMSAAPYRLGLTASPERADELHELLPDLIGGIIYEKSPEELVGRYLAPYEVVKIHVPLSKEEKELYKRHYEVFRSYIESRKIKFRSLEDFQRIVMRTGSDENAFKALRALEQARRIAFNSKKKIEKLRMILEKHRGEKIIIFTRHNDLVYAIS